ncbi:threonine synthase [Thermobacillus sp.]|uniref:threonine synthase n=1 Tax=Thermobacillus sp. TaxID=2108467 RepID=UPI00257D6E3C|nr:threonine synthase [Thermobacillus sp.]
MELVCIECGKARRPENVFAMSCDCGGLLEVRQDFRLADAERLKTLFDCRLALRTGPYASGVWRYKELIDPELEEAHIVTRGEGNTGLYDCAPAASHAGVRRVWLKAQGENPSGSFKDNGMTAAVSRGVFAGYRAFACASTGNTSSSLAMYAAWAGLRCVVLVPPGGVAANKLMQTLAYGAEVYGIEGGYDAGVRLLNRCGEALGLYVCNSVNPFRIEGQKSMIIEAAHQLGWTLPDWVVLPGGALSNASALGKGLLEMKAIGLIGKVPRIAVVQAEGASPFHRMIASGGGELVPEPAPRTAASAIRIGNPPSWRKAARVLRDCAGVTCAVSDEAIMAAKRVIDRSGIGCEPAAAAGLAGLKKLAAEGTISRDETALVVLTGHMLKDADALRVSVPDPGLSPLAPDELFSRLAGVR